MVPVSWHVHVRWHNCGLHPLIHTLLDFNLAQSIVGSQGKTSEKEAPLTCPVMTNVAAFGKNIFLNYF